MASPRTRETTHATLSAVLLAVAVLFLWIGSFCYWARAALFDPAGFSRYASAALLEDDVRSVVASRLADRIIERGSAEFVTVRPLLQSTIGALLGSESFRPVFRSVFADVHRTVFEDEDDTVVLGMSDAMIVLAGLLEHAYPDLAQRLPSNLQGVFITISERSYAVDLAQLAENASVLAYGLLTAALIAFGIAVWFDPSRRVLSRAGVGLAVSGVAGVAVLAIAAQLLLQDGNADARAAATAWRVFSGGLRAWMWGVSVGGIALGAAASSAAKVEDVYAAPAKLRSALREGAQTPGGRLLYATLFVTFGSVLVANPESALRFAVQLMGLLLLYAGVVGLGNAVRAGDARLIIPFGRLTLRIGTRLVALAIVGAGLVVGASIAIRHVFPSEDRPAPQSIDGPMRCNGWQQLCDRRFDEVAFATTHNSMSAASEPGWYFASHDRGIPEQLEAGIRGFLIDTHYGIEVDEGVRTYFIDTVDRSALRAGLGEEFVAAAQRLGQRWTSAGNPETRKPYLCHGFCELGATELVGALERVRRFLDDHPHEVLILVFEDYVRPIETAAAFESSGLIDLAYTHRRGQPFPTLRAMIESGERVLVLSEGKYGEGARPPWYHAAFELLQDTPFRFHDLNELSCQANRGTPQSPLFLINHWLEKITPSPADAARMNELDRLLSRARRCRDERGLFPNLIAVNFYARGDLLRAVDRMNGI